MRVVSVTAKPFGKIVDQTLELGPGLTVVYGRNGTGKSTWHAALYAGLYGRLSGHAATDVDEVVGAYRLPDRPALAVAIELELDTGVRLTVDRDLTGARPDSVTMAPEPDVAPYRIRDGLVDLSDIIGLDRRSFAVSSWLRQRRTPDEVINSSAPGLGLANPDISLAVGALLGTTEAERAVRRLARARAEHTPALHRCRAIVDERAGQLYAARQQRDRVQAARREVADRQREVEWAEQEYRRARAAADRRARDEQRRELEELRARLVTHGYVYGSVPTSRDTAVHPTVAEARRELDEALTAQSAAAGPELAYEKLAPPATPGPDERSAPEPSAPEPSATEPSKPSEQPGPGRGWALRDRIVAFVKPDQPAADEPPDGQSPPGPRSWRPRALRAGLVAAFGVAVSVVLWAARLDAAALLWMAVATVATATAAGLLPVLGPARRPAAEDQEPAPSTVARPAPAPAVRPETSVAVASASVMARPAAATIDDARSGAGPTGPDRVDRARARLAAALTERGVPARPDNVDAQFAVYQERCELAAQIAVKEAALAAAPADPVEPELNRPDIAKPLFPGQLEQLHEAWQSAIDAHELARRSLDALRHGFDDGAVSRAELALKEAHERHERHQRLDRALERAADLLQMAVDQASDRLRAKVEEALQVLLADVAEERGLRVMIDRNMRVHLSSDGLRSEGLLDQATVLTRVALSRHLARGEAVGPLFLDDVTSRIDEERTQHLLGALRQLARTRQVVVFAHDPTTRDWALRAADHDPSVRLLQTVAVDQPVRPLAAARTR